MESIETKAEKSECSVNGLTGQEGNGAVAIADCTAKGSIVLKGRGRSIFISWVEVKRRN